ncbi:MAG: hypothetical protein ACM3Q4_00570 [Acidobacteriota bacterium]
MKRKSTIYAGMLGALIAAFFMFTGGITSSVITAGKPVLSEFTLATASPVIYGKLAFKIYAKNTTIDEDDCARPKQQYQTARDLSGTLIITRGNVVVDSTNFTMAVETGDKENGFTGIFVDTTVINTPGTYTATALFYDTMNGRSRDSLTATSTMTFTVSTGSETPLIAGTYRLESFTAMPTSGSGAPYRYTNSSSSNILTINEDGHSAKLDINMQLGADAIATYPYLEQSSYVYSATGEYRIIRNGSSTAFRIEYEKSAFVTFDFTFDGMLLTLNYSKNGTSYVMKFMRKV